jgi:hypothetical protein
MIAPISAPNPVTRLDLMRPEPLVTAVVTPLLVTAVTPSVESQGARLASRDDLRKALGISEVAVSELGAGAPRFFREDAVVPQSLPRPELGRVEARGGSWIETTMSGMRGMRLTKPMPDRRGAELNEIRMPNSAEAKFVAAQQRAEIEETRGLQYQELRANALGTATRIAAAKRAEFQSVVASGSEADELSGASVQASMKARVVAARGLARVGGLKARHNLELQAASTHAEAEVQSAWRRLMQRRAEAKHARRVEAAA